MKVENRKSFRPGKEIESQAPSGLLPRRVRHARRPLRRSFKVWVAGGTALFGLLFIIVIGYELYRASTADKLTVRYEPTTPERLQAVQQSPVSSPPQQETAGQEAAVSLEAEPTAEGRAPVNAESTAGTSEAEGKQTAGGASTAAVKSEGAASVNDQPQTEPKVKQHVVRHTVQKGDTLFSLSRRYYGNNQGWKRIARYNGLNADDPLPIGKVLTIPSPTRS
ncbi:MAG: LysM peptidoglycan-binding domain-containing protein [Brevibacillus sp.]|nr:LysM peptidoglycan-binding domain-containing protein [Brevibacillus sp.]